MKDAYARPGLVGVGVDIESDRRFCGLDSVRDSDFLSRIFTEKELQYCFSKDSPRQSLAARFCAKEAAIKALSSIGLKGLELKDIEVTRDADGVPGILFPLDEGVGSKVSLSHAADMAVAFVVVWKDA